MLTSERVTVLATGLAAALMLSACGGSDDVLDGEDPAGVGGDATQQADVDDPFAGADPFAAGGEADDVPQGPGGLPAELQFLLDVPPGASLDHVEVFEGSHGPEYSMDASHREGGLDELESAADHYRSALPAAGFEIVDEYTTDDEVGIFVVGHGLDGSVMIDMDMGSVWINVFLAPEW